MDWKKEKISASELERRQKEYMNAAMSMVKRSHITAPPAPAAAEPEPEPEVQAEITEAETDIREEVIAVPDEEPASPPEPEPKHEHEPEAEPEPEPKSEPEPEPVHNEDSSYGVYTADELLNADTADEGMKKAAEILEEMTRNTRIMKQLAGESDDPDITDFPDFSCDTGSDGGGDCFREEDADASPEEECEPASDDE